MDARRGMQGVGRRFRALAAALLFVLSLCFVWLGLPGNALPQESPGGWPRVRDAVDRLLTTELVNPGFVAGYSEWYGVPRWVAYRADPPPTHRLQRRPAHFEPDPRTLRCRLGWYCVRHESYREIGRAHV